MPKQFSVATLGGTFDHFHKGHEAFLRAGFLHAEKVIIGITQPVLYQHKVLKDVIQPYEVRARAVQAYLKEYDYLTRATLVPIESMYGTTLEDTTLEAILVTPDTGKNAQQINRVRREQGWNPLVIIEIPFVLAEDGYPITSERIRRGEIDRPGHVYSSVFQTKQQLLLPEALRETLRQPIGDVFKILEEMKDFLSSARIIAVGDVVSSALYQAGYKPLLSITDGKTRRHTISDDIRTILPAPIQVMSNPAGMIRSNVAIHILDLLRMSLQDQQSQHLFIDGEEDLLTLPAILAAPLDSCVLYGQIDQGVVAVRTTEEKKKEVEALLQKFV